jgi:hypothetical protein
MLNPDVQVVTYCNLWPDGNLSAALTNRYTHEFWKTEAS